MVRLSCIPTAHRLLSLRLRTSYIAPHSSRAEDVLKISLYVYTASKQADVREYHKCRFGPCLPQTTKELLDISLDRSLCEPEHHSASASIFKIFRQEFMDSLLEFTSLFLFVFTPYSNIDKTN
jgi:hypothetical protein